MSAARLMVIPPNLLSLSKEELIALLAQTLLANQQLQQQLAALQQRPPDGRSVRRVADQQPTDWTKVKKTCSKCGDTKPVVPGFGLVTYRSGKQGANGYCSACRSKTSGKYRKQQREQKKH